MARFYDPATSDSSFLEPDNSAIYGGQTGNINYGNQTGSPNDSYNILFSGGGPTPDKEDNKSWFERNGKLLGLGIPAAGLGLSALLGGGKFPNQDLLENSGKSMIAQGQQLMQPLLNNAPLPTGAEASIQGAQQGQRAAILSNAAATGQMGSSATQQALQQADINAQAQRFQMATSLYTAGAAEVTGGNTELMNLGKLMLMQDQGLQNAIAGIAAQTSGVLIKDLFT